MSDMTLSALFEAYLEALDETEPERVSTRRSHLRSICNHLDGSEVSHRFVHFIDERLNAYKKAVPKRGSYAPAISTR